MSPLIFLSFVFCSSRFLCVLYSILLIFICHLLEQPIEYLNIHFSIWLFASQSPTRCYSSPVRCACEFVFFSLVFCRFYRVNKCAYRRIETKYFDMRFYCNIVAQTLNESTKLHERGKTHSLLPFVRPFVRSLNFYPNVVESVDGSLKVSS